MIHLPMSEGLLDIR